MHSLSATTFPARSRLQSAQGAIPPVQANRQTLSLSAAQPRKRRHAAHLVLLRPGTAVLRASPCSAKPVTGHVLACPMAARQLQVQFLAGAKLFFPAFEQFCRLAFYLAQGLALPTFFEDSLGVGIASAGQHLGDTLLASVALWPAHCILPMPAGFGNAFDVERMPGFYQFFPFHGPVPNCGSSVDRRSLAVLGAPHVGRQALVAYAEQPRSRPRRARPWQRERPRQAACESACRRGAAVRTLPPSALRAFARSASARRFN